MNKNYRKSIFGANVARKSETEASFSDNILAKSVINFFADRGRNRSILPTKLLELNNVQLDTTADENGNRTAEAKAYNRYVLEKHVNEGALSRIFFLNQYRNNYRVFYKPLFNFGKVDAYGNLSGGSNGNTAYTHLQVYSKEGIDLKISEPANLDKKGRFQAHFVPQATFRRGFDNQGKCYLMVAGNLSVRDTETDQSDSVTATFCYGEATAEKGKRPAELTFNKNIMNVQFVSFLHFSECSDIGTADGKHSFSWMDALNAVFQNNTQWTNTVRVKSQADYTIIAELYEEAEEQQVTPMTNTFDETESEEAPF